MKFYSSGFCDKTLSIIGSVTGIIVCQVRTTLQETTEHVSSWRHGFHVLEGSLYVTEDGGVDRDGSAAVSLRGYKLI